MGAEQRLSGVQRVAPTDLRTKRLAHQRVEPRRDALSARRLMQHIQLARHREAAHSGRCPGVASRFASCTQRVPLWPRQARASNTTGCKQKSLRGVSTYGSLMMMFQGRYRTEESAVYFRFLITLYWVGEFYYIYEGGETQYINLARDNTSHIRH